MVTQLSQIVIDCPTCGRPVELPAHETSQHQECAYCRGEFAILDKGHGAITAITPAPCGLMERVPGPFGETGQQADPYFSQGAAQPFGFSTPQDGEMDLNEGLGTAPDAEEAACDRRVPTALLVEFRDEVFIRIATDLAQTGMRVIRACSATEALELAVATRPALILANVDQPDQSGWLLTAKLRIIDPRVRVWLYQPRSSTYQALMAEFLDVEELLDYQGDLFRLSDTIVQLLDNAPEPIDATNVDELLVA